MYPVNFPGREDLDGQPEAMCRGGVIYDPLGNLIAGPLFDQEGILYADLDMSAITRA